jgi:DNA topoisomerase I
MERKKKEIKDPVSVFSEQEIRGNYVPVDEGDLKSAINVPVKEKVSEIIETKGKRVVKKKTFKKKVVKNKKFTKNNWKEKFKIPGPKELKKSGPILVITEKPQAAQKIAAALSEGKVKQSSLNKVSYYDLQKNEEEIQIVCAVGHLFSLAQVKPRNPWPTFEIEWAPNYLVRKNDFTKRYYDVIASLCKKASKIVVATDYDIEGEVIGMNIVRYLCNQKDAERMKFSTLTAKEIQTAYEKKSKSLDWPQGIAGETRHYMDWIYGINLSRALMEAVKTTGKFRLMSIGRVQGPCLNLIVKKEHEIEKFKSEKYWQVFLEINDDVNKTWVQYIKDISKEKELDKFKNLKGEKGIANTKKSERKINPPAPFDLTSLQTEAYRVHKITPSRTLQIAQSLYLAGLISYPRTSSQKLPKEIGYESIIERLKSKYGFTKFISKSDPVEGKKKDPAHPAIYPTGEFQELSEDDKKIYELIVKRFVSCFCSDAVLHNKKIEVLVKDLKFETRGTEIVENGWMNVYPYKVDEKEVPDFEGEVKVEEVKIEEKYTQPPKRYTQASIISLLEKKNLGTKATRSSIIETLYDRGYIKEKSIQATSLGISLIDTLEKNCQIIIDEKLTKDFERNLEHIRNSKNPQREEDKVLDETKKIIVKIGEKFSENKEKIGRDLVKATENLWEQEKKDSEIMDCEKCGKGRLSIKYNKNANRSFVACNAYPDCKTTYTLPPYGAIKKTDKTCEECNWPMLMSLRKGKRPWIFCFNPDCPSKNKE